MIKIIKIKKIQDMHLKQWFGRSENNEPVEILFRREELSIRVGKKDGNFWDAVNGKEIILKKVQTKYYGCLDYEDLVILCSDRIILPESENTEPFLGYNLE